MSVNYRNSNSVGDVTIIIYSLEKVFIGTASPKNSANAFIDAELYVGTGIPTEKKYTGFGCDCYLSNFNWILENYVGDVDGLLELKKKDIRNFF